MAIANVLVQSTNTAVFGSPTAGNNAITSITICNTAAYNEALPSANIELLYLYAVPAADVSGTLTSSKHLLVNGLPIPAGETVSLDQEKLVLGNGDKIIAKGTTNDGLAITISTLAV